ncbi:TRPM8 channel-associated factor-like protein [Labeo rohita]|uniref:TRPM8 channel-associated factor-like protein n=1 Tax=Labeo rohita TaxID=84645 RepID=A0A498N636_LABRO|nr:TRPM8 channel-associated factor-like protein [Labeo rohita]
MARKQDYYTIMYGLEELDLKMNAVPSDLVLIGEHAFPLLMNPRGQVLMAASHYGRGRVVVLGHEQYLTSFPGLIKNALKWLMPSTDDDGIVGIQKSLRSVAANLNDCPIKTELGDFRSGLAVYITDAYSVENCAKDLIAFIKAGGGLIMAGQAWHWAGTHPQENTLKNFPGNKVCSVAGIYFSKRYGEVGIFPVPKQIPYSWLALSIGKDFKDDLQILLEGVSEFDVQGASIASEVMVHGPLAFPIALTPAGKAFIAGAYYGQGRVILLSHECYVARNSLSTFLINAIKWLDEDRKGVIGILPSLKAAHTVLSKSGLDCQLTGFRKDLSVYVCTSYSDAQCAEIQEFVAEGGGLMIGGHAWYYAQTHRGHNVMTDYPGNHILNKMGLSLLGNTLTGGLYKAPEIEQNCKEGYHFCNMLHRFAEHVYLGKELTNHEQSWLKQLGNDCASYLQMRCHDSAAYISMAAILSDIVKKFGVPQVCSNCPVKSAKDRLMLHIGSEVYKVSHDPDALLPYIIKDRPKFPTVSNARVRISAKTEGVLSTFQGFLKKMQHEKTMAHLLHVEMVALVRELLSKFMKPEAIPLSAEDIIKVDVQSKDLQLSDKRLSVGRYCYSALNKARVERKIWVRNIYNSLREGYMKSSEFLLKNLPLDNKIITSLSALTPSLIQDDSICGAFITLGEALPEEIGQLEEEIRVYQIEVDLVTCAQNYIEEEGRVDVDWWSRVVSMKNPERDAP